jgi:hypothetical protein
MPVTAATTAAVKLEHQQQALLEIRAREMRKSC